MRSLGRIDVHVAGPLISPPPLVGEGCGDLAALPPGRSGVGGRRSKSARLGIEPPRALTPHHEQVRAAPRPEAMSGGHGDLLILSHKGRGAKGALAGFESPSRSS